MDKFCTNCGNELDNKNKFCLQCGEINKNYVKVTEHDEKAGPLKDTKQQKETVKAPNVEKGKKTKGLVALISGLAAIILILVNLETIQIKGAEIGLLKVDTSEYRLLDRSVSVFTETEDEYGGYNFTTEYEFKGEEKINGKKVFVYKLTDTDSYGERTHENYYKYSEEGLLYVGYKFGEYRWFDEPIVILPSDLKIGRKYRYKEDNIKRYIQATGFEDIKLDGKLFMHALVVKTKYYYKNELRIVRKEYYAKELGLVKRVEERHDDEEIYESVEQYVQKK
jgi:hypothetical protein